MLDKTFSGWDPASDTGMLHSHYEVIMIYTDKI